MAYFLGHYVGLSEGAASAKTIAIAEAILVMPLFQLLPVTGWSAWVFGTILALNKPPVVS